MFEKQNNTVAAVLVLGIAVLITLALAYPWYSHLVARYILGKDMEAAAAALGEATEKMRKEHQAAQQRAALEAQRRRVAQVKVTGVAEMQEPVVIAEMATASLNESRDTLCRQASQWLKRPLVGSTIRVRRHFRDKPAQDIGRLAC